MKKIITVWLFIAVFFVVLLLGALIERNYGSERGNPLCISDLEKGKIYVRPDEHPNIVSFFVEGGTDEKVIKVAFLPENCPKRFIIIDDNRTLRTVPVLLVGK